MDAYGFSMREQLDYGRETRRRCSRGGLAAAAVLSDLSPESETDSFFKTNGPEELTFIKNGRGEMTAVIPHRGQGLPDSEGKKLKNE